MIGSRPAGPEDLDDVTALAAAARRSVASQRGGPALLSTSVDAADVASGTGRVWCGLIGEVVVGYAVVDRSGDRAVITELFVDPDARGVGVGDALVTSIATWARDEGCTSLDAAALPGDRATKNFFEAHAMTSRLLVVSQSLVDPDQ